MRSSQKKNPPELLLLLVAFGVVSSSTFAWAFNDRTPPAWDPSDHLRWAYDYYQSLANLDFKAFGRDFFEAYHPYSPLVHLTSAGIFLIAGASRVAGILVNLVSVVLLMWSVWSIARFVYPDERGSGRSSALAAAVAAVIAVSYHFPAWLVHDAFLDYPLMAMVALGFALLLKAGDFRSRRDVVYAGLALGFGMWTKLSFVAFFILPLALWIPMVWRIVRSGHREERVNLALMVSIAVAITALWYVPHWQDTRTLLHINESSAITEGEPPRFSLASILYYWYTLFSTQIQVPFTLLFVVGSIRLIRGPIRKESALLFLWILSGILIFTFASNKDARYTVPILPAVALISVSPLAYWSGKGRKMFVAGIIVWSMASFFNAQWPPPGNGVSIVAGGLRWNVLGRNYFAFDHRPLQETWGIPESIRAVVQDSSASSHAPGHRPRLGVVVNLPFMNPSSAALYARLLASGRGGLPVAEVDWLVMDSARNRLQECDYLLVRTGLRHTEGKAPLEDEAEEMIRRNPSDFVQVANFPIPGQSEAVVYRCRPGSGRR